MSRIRVWTSDGRWSDEISGLDKVFLIKKAIRLSLFLTCYEEAVDSLDGYEINGCPVSDKLDDNDSLYFKDNIVDHELEEIVLDRLCRSLQLDQAETFVFPFDVLKRMKKDDLSLSAKYDQIISAAKVPAPTPKHYCLFLRFMDE